MIVLEISEMSYTHATLVLRKFLAMLQNYQPLQQQCYMQKKVDLQPWFQECCCFSLWSDVPSNIILNLLYLLIRSVHTHTHTTLYIYHCLSEHERFKISTVNFTLIPWQYCDSLWFPVSAESEPILIPGSSFYL